MTQTKIQGKFYPLQHAEWIRACQELTPSQRDVLYFIRTLDPYGNGIKISAAEIARQLSTPQKKVHRQTISRALKELDAKGFIDLELIEVKVTIKSKGHWCNQATAMDTDEADGEREDSEKSGAPEDADDTAERQENGKAVTVSSDTDGVIRHRWCDETPQAIATHHAGSSHTTLDRETPQAIATHPTPPETNSQSEVQNAKNIKIYSDFKKTLSESERENFRSFCQRKAQQYHKPVVLLDKWIEKNFEELYEEYQKVYGKDKLPAPVIQNSSSVIHPPQSEAELHPLIAAALKEGKITRLDPYYNPPGLWTDQGYWMSQDQWLSQQPR